MPTSDTSENSEVTSLKATVKTYTMNNRTGSGFELQGRYGLALKLIEGRLYTRMDILEEGETQAQRFIVTDGRQAVTVEGTTNRILSREILPENPGEKTKSLRTLAPRINLREVAENALRNKLALDASDDKVLEIKYAKDQLGYRWGQEIREATFTLRFDRENELLAASEMVEVKTNGDKITTTVTPLYKDLEGHPVKVGVLQEVEHKILEKRDVSDRTLPRVDNPEDIPIITREELETLRSQGHQVLQINPLVGDPADRSFTETTMEIYEDVELNTLSDRSFTQFFEE